MRTNKLLVVVHVRDNRNEYLENARIAFDNGADGIFLIGSSLSWSLEVVYRRLREAYPDSWIGCNFLDFEMEKTLGRMKFGGPEGLSGLWVDYPWVSKGYNTTLQEEFHRRLQRYNICYFGGVAFKYQLSSLHPNKEAEFVAPFVDVVTTSGMATGWPPSLEKVTGMREAIGEEKLLAIASGITPENVDPFLHLTDYFLVATGISKDFYHLDPTRVRMLANKMRR